MFDALATCGAEAASCEIVDVTSGIIGTTIDSGSGAEENKLYNNEKAFYTHQNPDI